MVGVYQVGIWSFIVVVSKQSSTIISVVDVLLMGGSVLFENVWVCTLWPSPTFRLGIMEENIYILLI